MRRLAFLLALLVAMPAAAGNFVRSYTPYFDLSIGQAYPDSVHATLDPMLLHETTTGDDYAIVIVFSTAALAEGEVLDSAYVVVASGGSPLDTVSVWCHEVLRSVSSLASWNQYDNANAWQTAGAWGALDIESTEDHGYGANGRLYQFGLPANQTPPDTLLVARGAGFTTHIDGALGGLVRLIWHADPGDGEGQYACSAAGGLGMAPRLRLWGHTTGNARRRIMAGE